MDRDTETPESTLRRYQYTTQNIFIMKKGFYVIIAIVLVLLACVVTCPDKQKHTDAINEVVSNVLKDNMDSDNEFAAFGAMLGNQLIKMMITEMLEVDNYFVCSVGHIEYKGEKKIVSFGIMNHIFTIDEERLQAELDKRDSSSDTGNVSVEANEQ